MALHRRIFTSSGTFTVPSGIPVIGVFAVGGGGGGGGAGSGFTTGPLPSYPGAGGGGAQGALIMLPTNPGETLTLTVGTGGAGGPADPVPNDAGRGTPGDDGTDTIVVGGLATLHFPGAGGGAGGEAANAGRFAAGGSPIRGTTANDGVFRNPVISGYPGVVNVPGQGGHAACADGGSGTQNLPGSASPGNSSFGAAGAFGIGFALGGGGGGAPGWVGGTGGAGGKAGDTGGTPTAGLPGVAGTFGGGGGGGGAGESGGTTVGGAGAAGGNGAIMLIWWT